ncbi:MAG: DUF4377 domain-containing protein [Xanthomonadaceae bacterium]|nr:DUF4377 domain-containing protein [Xanthomonadaceae bacterium]
MKRRFPVVSLAIVPLLLAACSKAPVETETTPADEAPDNSAISDTTPASAPAATPYVDDSLLTRHRWSLKEAVDAKGRTIGALLVRPDKPIQITFVDSRINVHNTCNGLSGVFQRLGDELRVEALIGTKMQCVEPEVAALDGEMSLRVQGSSRFTAQPGNTQSKSPPKLEWRAANGDILRFVGDMTPEARYGSQGETAFVEVAAFTKPCQPPMATAPQTCLEVREVQYDDQGIKTNAGPWRLFYDKIDGFTHEPGIRNVLRVKRYRRDGRPDDGTNIAYVMELSIESETVPAGASQ